MIEADTQSFAQQVLEASREQPVLVDFWAPWCAPCRALGPVLEKVEAVYAGRFKLVKINSDENPELAAQFGVRGIPAVYAVIDGQIADSFVGAQPESAVRAFVDKLLPAPSEVERRKAKALAAAGDHSGALAALRAAIALHPANDEARFDLAALLLDGGAAAALEEAAVLLDGASRPNQTTPRMVSLRSRLASLRRAAELPDEAALRARLAADPANLEVRLDMANLQISRRDYAGALESLLEIVERDRQFGADVGRRTMLSVFDLCDDPGMVSSYRKRLAAALNR